MKLASRLLRGLLRFRRRRERQVTSAASHVGGKSRHCERSEAIYRRDRADGLLRRFARRNDGEVRQRE
jgi:hypothetical protein